MIRVTVRLDLCESNGLCMGVAPEVFRLDENDTLQVLVETPDEALRAAVQQAAQLCPRGAIQLGNG